MPLETEATEREMMSGMKYRLLGRTGLRVSEICLGTMMFGGRTDEALSSQIIGKAIDNGINFIDTADIYNAGVSEEITGRAIAGRRPSLSRPLLLPLPPRTRVLIGSARRGA